MRRAWLWSCVILGFSVGAQPVRAQSDPENWRTCRLQASAEFAIPVAWIDAVIAAESGGRTHLNGRTITSRAGAMGLMQLMPGTYALMRKQYGLGPDPYAPCDNIRAGTAYLRAMFARFGYPGLFAAYNAGPTRYAAALKGKPLPPETRLYLRKVARAEPAIASGLTLFVEAGKPPQPEAPAALFVPLGQAGRSKGGP